jgi:MscS family membrane protein
MSLAFLYIVLKVVDIVIEIWSTTLAKKTKSQVDDVLLPLFHKATIVFFVIAGSLAVLKIWDIDIAPYLAGVGISGLVLGLALQDSLKNVFGGISMILDKNFHIGDPVQLETGELGTIKEIGLRSTKLLTYDAEVIFVPNGQLANMRIRNYVKPDRKIRKIVEFSVAYGTDPEQVKKIVLKTLQAMKDIYSEPYMDCIFTTMGDSGLHFKARFWVEWDHAYKKWLEATQNIYLALEKAGVEIPYPTRTIHLKK